MDKPKFVYVSYIQASPEKVWNALMDPELTKQYWFGHHNASDWKVGSSWKHQMYDDPSVVHIVGKVIESDPPRRLVVTWVSPENEGKEEMTTRVTYEIEPFGDSVKLTVRHEELYQEMFESVSFGWPNCDFQSEDTARNWQADAAGIRAFRLQMSCISERMILRLRCASLQALCYRRLRRLGAARLK